MDGRGWSTRACAEGQFDHGKAGENGQYSSLGSQAQADKTVGWRVWQQAQVDRYRLGHQPVASLASEAAQCTVRPA